MKFIDRWKQEWWLKHAGELAQHFNKKSEDLIHRFSEELKHTGEAWEHEKEIANRRIKLEEEEIRFRLEALEHRKAELAKLNDDLRTQIKIIEAKASPSEVWTQAFSAGVSKTWDLIQPFMMENIEKIKKKIYDEATENALRNLNGNHPKNH